MSDIKIKPSATGSATVTLTAPATGTARTVTLPDSTDTLAVNSDVTNKLPLAGGTLTGNLIAGGEIKVGTSDNGKITSTFALTLDPPTGEPIVFRTAGTDIARFRPGGGLCFGTDTAAANALDDYEEGTHVVTATMTSSGSVTLNRDTMSYTKVGRLVTCTGEIDISTTSSPSGAMKWTLPFAIANNSLDRDAYIGFKPVCYHVPFSGGIPPVAIGNTSAAHVIFVYEQHDAANASYVPYAGDAFNFTFSYITN